MTREAFIVSGNTEVAVTNRWGLMTAVRRGEAPILARYEGAYIATTLTVMGNRDGFEWKEPETWSEVDRLVAQKWERMKIEPSGSVQRCRVFTSSAPGPDRTASYGRAGQERFWLMNGILKRSDPRCDR